ncbi:hypothetical protein B296_00046624, partial [Ensete ventricosum]
QKNLDSLSPIRNAWMARDGWRYEIPWTCESESDRRSDFATELASKSGKLRKLPRLGAMVAPPQAGPFGSGLLVTPFAGVPSWGPIGAGAFILSVIGHSYLISLLPLLLTIPSYLSTTLVVLAVRRAPVGKGCRPYLC